MGRPSSYRVETANEILERLSNGEPLTKICRDDHMPSVSTVFLWEQKVEGFSEKVTRARELSADHFSHEIIEIADENPQVVIPTKNGCYEATDAAGVQRNKNRIETRIKLMQMLKRKTYGDKVGVEHSGSVDLGLADALAKARKRVESV